jgi:hypothetical protein
LHMRLQNRHNPDHVLSKGPSQRNKHWQGAA